MPSRPPTHRSIAGHSSVFRELLLLTLLSTLPLVLILLFSLQLGYRREQQAFADGLRTLNANTLARIGSFLAETNARIELLAQAPELDDPAEARRDAFLAAFGKLHPEFVNAMLLDRDGFVRAAAQFRGKFPPTSFAAFAPVAPSLRLDKPSVTHAVRGTVTKLWSAYLVHPLAEASGARRGTFLLPVNLGQLSPRLLDLRGPWHEQVLVLDAAGVVLMGSGNRDRAIGTVFPGFAALAAAADTEPLIHDLAGFEGERLSASVARIPGTQWLAAAVLPTRVVRDEPRRILLQNAAIAAAVLLTLIVLLRRQTRVIAGPIGELARVAREIAAGRRDIRATETGPREIAETARSFNAMLAAQHAAERDFRAIFEQAAAGVTLTTPQGRFINVNQKFADFTGYTRDELRQMAVPEITHPDDSPADAREIARVSAGETSVFDREKRYRRKDGTFVWGHLSVAGVRREDGQLTHMIGVVHDITAEKSAAQSIHEANAALEARVQERTAALQASNALLATANEELEAFTYSASHDLRSPLRNISGFLELLQHRAADRLDAEGQRYLATIRDETTRMDGLIKGLLEFSRFGRVELARKPTDLQSLATEAIGLLAAEVGDRRVEWRVALGARVLGDELLLRQVFVNLFSNAVKFSRDRDRATIGAGILPAGARSDLVTIFVRDNGVGFDPRYSSKLFGVFERLHRARDFQGIGIGLANVRRIVERHGGTVWAESRPAEGATFWFTLPAADAEG
jgi:PAS domain S-box-containing protein